MTNFPESLAKILIYTGMVLLIAGAMVFVLDRIGFFRLPGDIQMDGKNWKIFLPITTCIVLSIILTLLLWLINFLRR